MQDSLAIFAKRLLLAVAALSVLGSLAPPLTAPAKPAAPCPLTERSAGPLFKTRMIPIGGPRFG